MPAREARATRGDTGLVTTRLARQPKRFSMPKPARGALTDPAGNDYPGLLFGRLPYRDSNPGLWGVGGNVLFYPSLSSANREIIPYRDKAVANAREADRNTPLINAGIDFRAVNTVGANLRLQYLPNWKAMGVDPDSADARAFIENVENEFSLWAEDHRLLGDAQRQGQFGAQMLLSCRECGGTEGETLVIARYDEERMERYRARFATFIEVVNCDRLSTPSGWVDRPGQPQIVAGKEIDEYGAAVAYHVETSHPTDANGERTWRRIVRETEWGRPVGIHFFFRSRAGMQRNMPAIIQSLRSVKMLDRFDDVTLQRAVTKSILSIFVESQGTSEEMLQKLTAQTPAGASNPVAELWDKRFGLYDELALTADGIRIPVLAPGDKINIAAAKSGDAPDVSDFHSVFKRSMARQLHLTYEQFSGDYSETTFSSARAAVLDGWRLVTVDRILFTQHVPLQCFAAFLEELWVRGDEIGFEWPDSLPPFFENMTAYCQAEFRGPGMGWVDPEKDVNAAGKRVERAFTSPTYEASQQGQDFRDNVDQIARDWAYARSKGVILPGMPEYAAMENPPAQANDDEDTGGDEDQADDEDRPPSDSGEAADQENRR